MHFARPSSPRLQPIAAVAEKAKEWMKDLPVNAVNVTATMAYNRTLAKAFGPFAQAVLFHGGLSRRNVELAVLRMGWNCQAVYEFGQHTLFGRSVGLTDAEIYLITRPLSQGTWTDVERALLQMTDDLYADDCVSDATWAELEALFNHSDILEFMFGALCYRLVSGMLNSCGVQLDDGVPGWPTAPASISAGVES